MEQGNVSIVTSNGNVEGTNSKTKRTISLPTTSTLSNAAKIKAPWLKSLLQNECSAWDMTKCGLAEMIGTAILVFIGCMGCVGGLNSQPTSLQISLVFGLVVMLIIQSIGHISDAHINPAITVGAVVLGKKSLTTALIYLFAQCIGAILGYGLLKAVTPSEIMYSPNGMLDSFCVTDLHRSVSIIQGLLGEIIVTAILMFMTCAVWDSRNERNTDSTPIKFGLTVAVLCMALGPYTGCSMNPARSLAPAIWNNYWSHHWIYWFGPIGGALVASVTYRSVFSLNKYTPENRRVLSNSQKAEI